MTDLVVRLRTRPTGDPHLHALVNAAADEIERLRLFEHYANRNIEGLVADAIDEKKRTGKYPFED